MESIDLTPEGLTTPEGIARVNRATEAQQNAIARAANALDSLLDMLSCVEFYGSEHETLQEAREARALRRAADEELIRSLCGRPPAGR